MAKAQRMSQGDAEAAFRELVHQYGTRWHEKKVPKSAYDRLAEINRTLTVRDRRRILGCDTH